MVYLLEKVLSGFHTLFERKYIKIDIQYKKKSQDQQAIDFHSVSSKNKMAHDVAREIVLISQRQAKQIEIDETFTVKTIMEVFDEDGNGVFDTLIFDVLKMPKDVLRIKISGLYYQQSLNIKDNKRIKSISHKLQSSPTQLDAANVIFSQYFKYFLDGISINQIFKNAVMSVSITTTDDTILLSEKWEYFNPQLESVKIPEECVEKMFKPLWKFCQIAISMIKVEKEEQELIEEVINEEIDDEGEFADF